MAEVSQHLILQLIAVLLLCLNESQCSSVRNYVGSNLLEVEHSRLFPDISPNVDTQPLLPLLAPSPMMPFTSIGVPRLSGFCSFNFSAAESMLSITATDCWAPFAPYLANAVCCPQFDATLTILIGQSSKYSGELALDATHAKHCLSDVEQILQAQGAIERLSKTCSINPSNLTKGSCPVIDVDEIDSMVDSSRLLVACGKIDAVNECCHQVCQDAVSDNAQTIYSKAYGNSSLHVGRVLPANLSMIDDCKKVVLRWLARRLDPSSSSSTLRAISSCYKNKVCPLVLPDAINVTRECGNVVSTLTCCNAMESYLFDLQEQSLITNLQALNCAALLGMKLQKANVTDNVYNLCQINLGDFSLQAGATVTSQDSGCLLPSSPSDVTYDERYGVGFICDANDNVVAPWPSSSFLPASLCNKTTTLPAIPSVMSAQSGLVINALIHALLVAIPCFLFLTLLV